MTFSPIGDPVIGAFGILIMGYGDGMAAMVGKKFGKITFKIHGSRKSLEGSMAMFIISFVISCILLIYVHSPEIFFFGLLIALIATILECITPQGFDNLTVPLGISLLYWTLKSIV